MIKPKNSETIKNIIYWSILVLALAMIYLAYGFSFMTPVKYIANDNKVIDLSKVSIPARQGIYLGSEADFYYNQLIISENVENPTPLTSVSIPLEWKQIAKEIKNETGQKITNLKKASYQIYVNNVDVSNGEQVSIYFTRFPGNYAVYLNGELVTAQNMEINGKRQSFINPINPLDFTESVNTITIETTSVINRGYQSNLMISSFKTSRYDITINNTIIWLFIGLSFSFLLAHIMVSKNLKIKPRIEHIVLLVLVVIHTLLAGGLSIYTTTMLVPYNIEISNIISTLLMIPIVLLLLKYMSEITKIKISKTSYAISGGVIVIAYFFQLLNIFLGIRTFKYLMVTIVTIYGMYLVIRVFMKRKEARMNSNINLVIFASITLYSGKFMEIFYSSGSPIQVPFSFYFAFTLVSVIAIFILQIKNIEELSLNQRREEEIKSKAESEKTKLVLSQLRPHFTFNALTNIQYLVKSDPKECTSAIAHFGKYLRGNINSINYEAATFNEELDHIDSYLHLERIRFGNKIVYEYDIKETTFLIPPLSVLTLIENVVSQNVSKQRYGGKVTIRTSSDSQNYYIDVINENKELSKEVLNDEHDKSVASIRWVSENLVNLKLGTLDISNSNGLTTARITLTKEGQNLYAKEHENESNGRRR